LAQPALRWAANLYVELSNLFNFTGRRFPTECPPSRRKVHQSGGIRTTPTAYAPSRRKLHHPDGIRSTFGIKARRNSDQYKVTCGVVAVGSSGQQVCKKGSHVGIMATAKATSPRKTMGQNVFIWGSGCCQSKTNKPREMGTNGYTIPRPHEPWGRIETSFCFVCIG
jgi:hypothetical protein